MSGRAVGLHDVPFGYQPDTGADDRGIGGDLSRQQPAERLGLEVDVTIGEQHELRGDRAQPDVAGSG